MISEILNFLKNHCWARFLSCHPCHCPLEKASNDLCDTSKCSCISEHNLLSKGQIGGSLTIADQNDELLWRYRALSPTDFIMLLELIWNSWTVLQLNSNGTGEGCESWGQGRWLDNTITPLLRAKAESALLLKGGAMKTWSHPTLP